MMKLFLKLKTKSFDAAHLIAALSIFIFVLTLAIDFVLHREIIAKGIVSVLICVQVFNLLLSSLCDKRFSYIFSKGFLILQAMNFFESILVISGYPGLEWPGWFGLITMFLIVFALIVFTWGIWRRVSNLRLLTRDGTVWGNMQLCVDSLYAVAYISAAFMGLAGSLTAGQPGKVVMSAVFLLLVFQLAALVVRMHRDSLMVFRSTYENTVLESLKISQIEISSGPKPEAYRELYDRILEYFEKEKPFLSSKLTVSDVARVVFSNKSYISRVISIFTGRNFCQFVNYYRITYAMDIFRADPTLKITQLAAMSGFNSVVSFNTSFRLFLDENPSDWCRKERRKLLKKKK